MGFSTPNNTFQLDIVSDQVAPPWLQNPVGGAYLQTMGMGLDLIRYRSAQASLVHMPGLGDPSANYYIGLDRVLTQGVNEPAATFVIRLKTAYDTWQHGGNDWAVLQETLALLTPAQPKAAVVNNVGKWSWYNEAASTAIPPSTFVAVTSNWNWDGNAFDPHPLSPTAWWRMWLILFAGTNVVGGTITNATNASPIEFTTASNHGLTTGNTVYIDQIGGNLGANGGPFSVVVDSVTTFHVVGLNGTGAYTSGGFVYNPDAQFWAAPAPTLGQPSAPALGAAPNMSLGFLNVPPSFWTTLIAVLSSWKSASAWLRWVIVSYDSTWFVQDATANQPNGTWGPNTTFSTDGNGRTSYVATRFTNARFVPGVM